MEITLICELCPKTIRTDDLDKAREYGWKIRGTSVFCPDCEDDGL